MLIDLRELEGALFEMNMSCSQRLLDIHFLVNKLFGLRMASLLLE